MADTLMDLFEYPPQYQMLICQPSLEMLSGDQLK